MGLAPAVASIFVLALVAGTRAGGDASKADSPVHFKSTLTIEEQEEARQWYCGVSTELRMEDRPIEKLVDWRMRLLRHHGERVSLTGDTIDHHATAFFRRVSATPVPISLFAVLNNIRSKHEAGQEEPDELSTKLRAECMNWMSDNVTADDEPSALPSLLALWSIRGRRVFVDMLLLGLSSGSKWYTAGAELPMHEDDDELPKEFDLRDKAREEGVDCIAFKPGNQAECGSCWAFSVAAAMSLRYCLQSHGNINTFVSPADVFRLKGAEGWLSTAEVGNQGSDMLGIAAAAATMGDQRMNVRSAECSMYECVPATEKALARDLRRELAMQRVSPMSPDERSGVLLRHTARLWLAKTKNKRKKDFQVRAKEGKSPNCDAMGGEETVYGTNLHRRIAFIAPDSVKQYEGEEGQQKLREWVKRELITRGALVFGVDVSWMGMSNSELLVDFMKGDTVRPHAMTLIGWTKNQWSKPRGLWCVV